MPTLLGIALGILMSLAVEALIGPHVSVRAKATISLVVFFSVAYAVRRYLTRLRRGGG